jgi:hypothetical protein
MIRIYPYHKKRRREAIDLLEKRKKKELITEGLLDAKYLSCAIKSFFNRSPFI